MILGEETAVGLKSCRAWEADTEPVVQEQSCPTLVPTLCSDRMVSGDISFPDGVSFPQSTHSAGQNL